jgi:hypothetical protein
MLYKATTSFSGPQISMSKGKVCEISDPALIADLTRAGYIVPFESTAPKAAEKAQPKEDEPEKPKTKKGGTKK